MTSLHRKFSLSPRASFFLGVLAVLGIFAATIRWAPATHAQQQEPYAEQEQERDELSPYATTGTPSIALQYASIVGTGNTITISRAPVTKSDNTLAYEDITVQLAVGASGAITNASSSPKWVVSPNLIVAGFQAWTYLSSPSVDAGKMGFVLSGPGVATNGTVWTISTAKGDDACTVPGTASFFVGPLTSNPIYSRLKTAGITSTNMSYGTLGTQSCWPSGVSDNNWATNAIVGLSQVGNTITISSFSNNWGGMKDQKIPYDQLTFTAK